MKHVHIAITMFLLVCTSQLAACADGAESVPEGMTQVALRASERTLEHGELWFRALTEAELTRQDRAHSWTFELPARAEVQLGTHPAATSPAIDAVVHLYRKTECGAWSRVGSSTPCEDAGCSRLARTLPRGRYRAVVEGRTRAVRGSFQLSAYCSGAGCKRPVQPADCVLGHTLRDVTGVLYASTIQTLRSSERLPDGLAAEQLVRSAASSPDSDVDSPKELFERVDDHLVHFLRIWDVEASREFRAFEYRIGGRSYGGVFPADGREPVADVAGGTLQQCTVPVAHCTLGRTYHELRDDGSFRIESQVKLYADSASSLSELEQTQLVRAAQIAYEEAVDVMDAFASVDQGEVNQLLLTHVETGRQVTAYEYGAGDNSYGGVFAAGSDQLVARIEDGDLYGCTMLE